MAAVEERIGRVLTASEREWLRVRAYLTEHRYELGRAAAHEYPNVLHVAGTPLLSRPEWIPREPLPLDKITLDFHPSASMQHVNYDAATSTVHPIRADGSRYPCYSTAMAELAAPAVFENRPTYRLLEADLTGPGGHLAFSRGHYFDGIDVGEAAAHEYAAAKILGRPTAGSLRATIGSPIDPNSRPVNVAISSLTIRRGHSSNDSTFLLHWRDPSKVGHAGGLYQVIPVGVFQPSASEAAHERADFDLWRCMVREYAEELLGEPEHVTADGSPIDYESWPTAARLTQAVRAGNVHAYCLGLGVDPLTFATDLLTAVVFDGGTFDEIFGDAVQVNAEGRLAQWRSDGVGHPFTGEIVEHYARHKPMQAAGAALLELAHGNRATLLR